ncbi:MAG: 1,4-dihydroxy-2-naphthoate octaprenyltransferase, partial [bacterium]
FAGVLGTYFLNTKMVNWMVLLPALSLGFLSMGVLNLNNMRDIDNDRRSGKQTVASRLGLSKAKIYHAFLLVASIAAAIVYVVLSYRSPLNYLFVLPSGIILKDLILIIKQKDQASLDPYLKKLAIATFLFTLCFGFGILF